MHSGLKKKYSNQIDAQPRDPHPYGRSSGITLSGSTIVKVSVMNTGDCLTKRRGSIYEKITDQINQISNIYFPIQIHIARF
jgi:hypothetical protein